MVTSNGHGAIERPEAHEHRDANVRGVGIFLVSLLGFLAVSLVAVYGLYRWFESRPEPVASDYSPSPLMPERQIPPRPRLQVVPQRELLALRAEEDSILNSYGWVDRNAGIVRIPIDRAIDLVAQRGLPARASGGPR